MGKKDDFSSLKNTENYDKLWLSWLLIIPIYIYICKYAHWTNKDIKLKSVK